MERNGRFAWLWCAIVLVLPGCSGTSNVKPSSGGTDSAKAAAAAAEPTRVTFRLAADGLPLEGRWKSTPALADVNGDGLVDLAIHPRLAGGARVWLSNGKGGWTESSQGLEMKQSCGGGLQIADLNKDGKLDLAVADHCNAIHAYLGDGTGRWQVATANLNSAMARKMDIDQPDTNYLTGTEVVAVGDINGDGLLDLVVGSSDQGGVTVYRGDGTGKNWKEVESSGLPSAENPGDESAPYGGWVNDLHLIDISGDGCLDVVAAYYRGPSVWWGDCKGHFAEHSVGLTHSTMGGLYRKVAVADLNGDGRLDLAIANIVNGVEAFLQNADGGWSGPVDIMPELKGGATAVAFGDLDGDGNIDAVIGGAIVRNQLQPYDPWGLYVRLGDGKGRWVDGKGTKLSDKGLEVIWGITLVDVNRDGRLDVVVSTGGATGKAKGPGSDPPCRQRSPGEKGERIYKEGVSPWDAGIEGSGACLPRLQVWISEAPSRR